MVGYVREATEGEVSRALDAAAAAGPIWFATPPTERAAILERAAELMESQLQSLLGILSDRLPPPDNRPAPARGTKRRLTFGRRQSLQLLQTWSTPYAINDSVLPNGISVGVGPDTWIEPGNSASASPSKRTVMWPSSRRFCVATLPTAVMA